VRSASAPILLLALAVPVLAPGLARADEAPAPARAEDAAAPPFVQVRLGAELGFLSPLAHSLQFSEGNSRFDYVAEGGQDTLYLFARLTAELELARRHTITLLYQPLDLRSTPVAKRDLTIDNIAFPEGTPLDLRYGFDFWRLSYLYDFFADPGVELGIGG